MTEYRNPHHVPRSGGDRFAWAFVRFLRLFADLFFARRYGHRAIVLETVSALSRVGGDQAVPALNALMRRKKFLAPRKGKALKATSLAALRAIQTPAATRAIDDAARTGDRMLRKLARAGA